MCNPNEVIMAQMINSGFSPGKGLGKNEDGTFHPIEAHGKTGKIKLGVFLMGAVDSSAPSWHCADPITWKGDSPIWVDQWCLMTKTLQTAQLQVQEQLQAGQSLYWMYLN